MRHFIATALLSSAIIAISATAKPHDSRPSHEAGFAPLGAELPRIKGIAPEIFANASKEAQIRALQIEAKLHNSLHKATQRFRDEREKLELEKKILQVRLHHAKAQNDEATTKDLLNQIHQNEQALDKNKLEESVWRAKEELELKDALYKELRK
ncbi:hypothetical protein ACWIWK_00300 [Helicobacter sp. 23-1048]